MSKVASSLVTVYEDQIGSIGGEGVIWIKMVHIVN